MACYGVDLTQTIAGEGPPPLLVVALVEGLPEESLTVALRSGGRELRGWTEDRALLAAIYDWVQLGAISGGNWKKGKAPKFEPWKRPDVKPTKKTKAKVTVKELHTKFLKRRRE